VNLGDALTQYLSGTAHRLDSYAHQELNRFGRAVGLGREIEGLAPPDVAHYAESVITAGGDIHGRLGPVKDFLAFLKKKQLSSHSLSAHVKIPRSSVRAAAAAKLAFETIDMTEGGIESLKIELARLIGQRPEIVEAIRIAAADKDFRENAPLDAARENQGLAETRIKELQEILRRAVVVDRSRAAGTKDARVGATVQLRDAETSKNVTYTLVDSTEADPSSGKISVVSPVGSALVGKVKGDVINVNAPNGSRSYVVTSVKL